MENVRGHLSMGFGDVLADLAKIGYDAEWQVIPAAAVGASPARRASAPRAPPAARAPATAATTRAATIDSNSN